MIATRTFDILERGIDIYNGRTVLASKQNGVWIEYDIHAYIENCNYLSYGLLALGLNKGDKVATVSNNRPEWNFVDMAVSQAGMIHVPIYSTIATKSISIFLATPNRELFLLRIKPCTKNFNPLRRKYLILLAFTLL